VDCLSKIKVSGSQNLLKIDKKSIKNQVKKSSYFDLDFYRFLIDFGGQVGTKIHEKSIKNRSEKVIQQVINFWIDFGSIWVPNLAPRSPSDPQLGGQEGPLGAQLEATWAQMGRT